MSGGPVVDSDGRVIGVIVSGADVISQANMTERHGFIPAATLVRFLRASGLWPDNASA
jgi:S1-C subfamily serine protease